jgi:hypothetical protein
MEESICICSGNRRRNQSASEAETIMRVFSEERWSASSSFANFENAQDKDPKAKFINVHTPIYDEMEFIFL